VLVTSTRPAATDTLSDDASSSMRGQAGDSGWLFSLPGGAVRYALGAEYRKEKSESSFSNEDLGILDDGRNISTLSSNVNLFLNDQVRVFNASGEFDVKEVFGELRLPLLARKPFAHELSVEAAARYADYSTIGSASTWNLATTWAPVPDLRLRGSYSKAIRAPDIFELFSPQQATTFRPSDPCNISDINRRIAAGLPNAELRKANCAAALTGAGREPQHL
jgi:outer membrane receptor protein involved in Fe transport